MHLTPPSPPREDVENPTKLGEDTVSQEKTVKILIHGPEGGHAGDKLGVGKEVWVWAPWDIIPSLSRDEDQKRGSEEEEEEEVLVIHRYYIQDVGSS